MEKNNQINGIYFWMLFVPLFWGGAFGAAGHVVTEISPFIAAALRFGAASIILLGIVWLRSEWKTSVIKNHWRGLALMALTGIFGYNAFFFAALEHTSAINGSLIMATTPVFVTAGAVLFLKETWSRQLGIGLFLSLTGVFLVIIKGSIQVLSSLSFNTGDLLFVAGLICWVVHGLIGKKVMTGVSPLFTTTVTMTSGSLMLLIVSFYTGEWERVLQMSGQSVIEMIFMIICSTVIAFLLWNKGIHEIGASKSSMYMNLVPINAAWIAVAFYGSKMTLVQVIGMAMVILGVYIATKKTKTGVLFQKKAG